MRSYIIRAGGSSLDDLVMVERDEPKPGPREILVRVRACSLNYRDQVILSGDTALRGPVSSDIVPLSDGAGEIVALGADVGGWKIGDRVAGNFWLDWLDGPPPDEPGPSIGDKDAPGMLAEYVALPERALVRLAGNLSYEEAATLPCAGVTAWNGLAAFACPASSRVCSMLASCPSPSAEPVMKIRAMPVPSPPRANRSASGS